MSSIILGKTNKNNTKKKRKKETRYYKASKLSLAAFALVSVSIVTTSYPALCSAPLITVPEYNRVNNMLVRECEREEEKVSVGV